MKRIWWCSVVVYPPQFLDPFFVAFFVSPANANGKKNIISPSKTPVIKPYGPPPGEDVHDVSLLQFATHVLCQVGSRQPVGMPRRNGQQVTYQSWEETMEWVSICQRSSMNIKIAVPSKRTACDTANIYIYIYISYSRCWSWSATKLCHNTLGSLNPAPRHETVPVSGQDAAAVGEWPTSRILESKSVPLLSDHTWRECFFFPWVESWYCSKGRFFGSTPTLQMHATLWQAVNQSNLAAQIQRNQCQADTNNALWPQIS